MCGSFFSSRARESGDTAEGRSTTLRRGTYGAQRRDFEQALQLLCTYEKQLDLARLIAGRTTLSALPGLIANVIAGEQRLTGKMLVETMRDPE
jgi:hypothetical protein